MQLWGLEHPKEAAHPSGCGHSVGPSSLQPGDAAHRISCNKLGRWITFSFPQCHFSGYLPGSAGSRMSLCVMCATHRATDQPQPWLRVVLPRQGGQHHLHPCALTPRFPPAGEGDADAEAAAVAAILLGSQQDPGARHTADAADGCQQQWHHYAQPSVHIQVQPHHL